jgi:hypothetical protein
MTTETQHKKTDFRFFHRLRVRWAEVDMQKIVFNAHYLMYFDTAIADYWRALALPYEEAMHAARRRSLRAQGHDRVQRLGARGRPARRRDEVRAAWAIRRSCSTARSSAARSCW